MSMGRINGTINVEADSVKVRMPYQSRRGCVHSRRDRERTNKHKCEKERRSIIGGFLFMYN